MSGGFSVCSVVGARPQFIKLAPVCLAIDRWNSAHAGRELAHTIVHTGQHYDADMSDAQWAALNLPTADINLGVGSGSHGAQTGGMLARIEEILLASRYDAMIVYGDTNSTLAGALAAVKLHVAAIHVEAGLRSRDRRMPEEINRIVADHAADLLLAPTHAALETLKEESLGARSAWVGDVMLDAIELFRGRAPALAQLDEGIRPSGKFGLVTVHRAENTEPAMLARILAALDALAAEIPLLFPVHPRTAAVIGREFRDWPGKTRVVLTRPVNYLEMIALADAASVVLTDSGGLLKESMFLGTPCVTLRDRTEWPESLSVGANRLAAGGSTENVVAAATAALNDPAAGQWIDQILPEYGGGQAADRIVAAMTEFLSGRDRV